MNFSQVATQEISDNDLDNVSGGLLGTPVLANATGLVDSVFPVSATAGSLVTPSRASPASTPPRPRVSPPPPSPASDPPVFR